MVRDIQHIPVPKLAMHERWQGDPALQPHLRDDCHHFFIDCDISDMQAMKEWCKKECQSPWTFYPETKVTDTPTSSVLLFHVIITSDRDAALFKLSW